eukprot:TRINITY_DN5592_c0_g1_i1.p1 TRINITY_DN5592_c0_g1~~TRINITY_DN5592_c0_g1_i1.p1  ORF type:complete len:452 (+),score=87.46 TRINITY_DN5592_c0_g1_i1:67-1422(+)
MSKNVKVKVLSRNETEFTRERKQDVVKMFRNADPKIHPFERAREYVRALNAAKWDRLFAKPFLFALNAHADGVYTLATVPNSLSHVVSGAGDGEIRVWNISTRATIWSAKGHDGIVGGVVCAPAGDICYSCARDKTIKSWNLKPQNEDDVKSITPISTFLGQHGYNSIDHHWKQSLFVTGSTQVDIWDPLRSEPVHSFTWGADSVNCVRFNRVETNVLASCATDRNIVLYDVRLKCPLKKVIMQMSTNDICWNPMEAFNFSTANEDTNCYTFDMRRLDKTLNVHQDHVAAVMHLDYAPTGTEFVTGSYDRTIRIFPVDSGHSREVYHTKRMQRIFTVKFSGDNKYVLSGSDDANIRVWKARASEQLKPTLAREQNRMNYLDKVKERYKNFREISRILRHRHVPKAILNARKRRDVIRQSQRRKLQNIIAHSKPNSVAHVSERKKKIVAVQD